MSNEFTPQQLKVNIYIIINFNQYFLSYSSYLLIITFKLNYSHILNALSQ